MKATITIPEDLSEITLGQYQTFLKTSEGLEGRIVLLVERERAVVADEQRA